MSHALIICEKPSAAKAIADALAENGIKKYGEKNAVWYEFQRDGKNFIAAPAVGHLFTLKQTGKGWDYPRFDVEWVPSFKASRFAAFSEPYFRNMEQLAKGANDFFVATDYDDEGEIIGYNILSLICGKNDAARMKFSTMVKEELIESYEHAATSLNKNLAESGFTRHYLDWYWGINLTRALTNAIKAANKRFRILSTGRVQGPVLHMLARHEKKIQAFKPKPFWQIEAQIEIGKETLKAQYEKDKIWDRKEAEKLLEKAKAKDAVVTDIKTRKYTQKPPIPYNTTSLLADIYRYFGYSPQQGMMLAEELYQKGYISYPRTASEKLPADINYKRIITSLSKRKEYEKGASLLLQGSLKPNEGAKKDPAHPAVYPTWQVPKLLGNRQKNVYDLVVRRFMAVFGEPAKRESQKIIFDVNGALFSVTGKRTLEAALNENSFDVEFHKPQLISRRKLMKNEKLFCISINGGELKATGDHPIYLFDGGVKLKAAKDISKGDKLLSIISKNKTGAPLADESWFLNRNFKLYNDMYLNKFSSKGNLGINRNALPIKWTSDLAWLLGYFYGDGSYSSPKYNGSHQVYFTTTEKKALNILKKRIKRIFGVELGVYLVKNNQYKVQCNALISRFMAENFPEIKSKARFDIPAEFCGDFLRGFFDADGNVHFRNIGPVKIQGTACMAHGVPRVKISLARKDHILWIKDLLASIGIEVMVHEQKAKLKEKYFDCFTIRIGSRDNVDRYAWKVGFDVDHKRNILYKGLMADCLRYKRLQVCYALLLALKKHDLDACQLKHITGYNAYEIETALKRLVKLGIIKRKRLSPYSRPPNRVLYEILDKDYFIHALRASYEHISGELYASEVTSIEELNDDNLFVFDISVSPESPNFITNGSVLVHNSTRSSILQILYNRGYLIGSSIEVTELGVNLANILEKNVSEVVSEKLTRHFEEECDLVEQGNKKREDVLEDAKKTIEKISAEFKKKEKKIGEELTDAVIATQDKQNKLGVCLKCGGTLKVHKNWKTKKRFVGCSGYKKGCRVGFPLPHEGLIMSTGKTCNECKTPIIQVRRQGGRPFRMCLDMECPTKKDWLDKAKLEKAKKESRKTSEEAKKTVQSKIS
ncbi:MAG: DNA topoisomerase I [Candidatus Aenigmarchaeota archaeon]|nr:DNA topoisomerase I [Candidatus Aenigmarchaeota archaeon]